MTIISYIINAVPIRNNTRGGGMFYIIASPDLHANGTGFTSLHISCDKCPGLCSQDIEVPECLKVVAVVSAGLGEDGVEGDHESCNRLVATT